MSELYRQPYITHRYLRAGWPAFFGYSANLATLHKIKGKSIYKIVCNDVQTSKKTNKFSGQLEDSDVNNLEIKKLGCLNSSDVFEINANAVDIQQVSFLHHMV